jgi:cytochrome c biogenesis protein CcmG, thiol:disulfide interchange protein DsbE
VEELQRTFKDRGLTILGINIQENQEQVARWVKEKGVSVPVLLDTDKGVTRTYLVRGTPTVILIGRDGQLIGRAAGPRGWMTEAGQKLLAAFVAR